ncbi:MAG TPA: GtrA family protein [Rhizomicrobium sp.]|jgi:putative flippase GtrA|nr:GtrA family protein [Rhizomicrobium sp.]
MATGPGVRAIFGTLVRTLAKLYSVAGRGTLNRTTRYTLVGGLCAAIHNGIMIFGSREGGDYVSLSVLAFLVVTPIGYLLHARFTFGTPRSWQDFARFASSIAASFPIYFGVMAVLCSGLHLIIPVAAPIATIAMYLWNYGSAHWALRSWVLARRR